MQNCRHWWQSDILPHSGTCTILLPPWARPREGDDTTTFMGQYCDLHSYFSVDNAR